MIYGDEPQKWNEWQGEEDPLGLHAYTYKPEATAVAQAGNLYAYCGGNPLLYKDRTGNVFVIDDAVVIIVGIVIVGVAVYGAARAAVNSPQGQKFVNGAAQAISNGFSSAGEKGNSILQSKKKQQDAPQKQKGKDGEVKTPETAPGEFTPLRNGQGYKDKKGNIWKKDKLHKDHWDVSNSKGKKIKEVDYNGREIWPNGPKNKNK